MNMENILSHMALRASVVASILFGVLQGCGNTSITASQSQERLEEFVFVAKLVDDKPKQQAYLAYHNEVWPEVEAGFRAAGYREISLYRFHDLLVMTVKVPVGANLDQMSKVAESYDKRCAEWNRTMNGFQTGVEGTAPNQTWVEAKPFYVFRNERNHTE
jgi:L-rhamnose mutarotase